MKIDAKKSQSSWTTAGAGNRAGRKHAAEGGQRAARRKSRMDQLQRDASGAADHRESALLAVAHGTSIRPSLEQTLEKCQDCKLLPLVVSNHAQMALFLLRIAGAARAASRASGVPASLLIADAWQSGPCELAEDEPEKPNDWFGTGESFPSIEAAFLDHARRLARKRKFQPVMRAAKDAAGYLKAFAACELWNDDERANHLQMIETYNLQECDLPAGKAEGLDWARVTF